MINKFNKWIAGKITGAVATMWCAYLFAAIAIYGFPRGSHNARELVAWFAQTFLQLVLLSIILVGQKLSSEKSAEHHRAIIDMHKQTQDQLHNHIEQRITKLTEKIDA